MSAMLGHRAAARRCHAYAWLGTHEAKAAQQRVDATGPSFGKDDDYRRFQCACCSKKRCASNAAMQPVPAEVMAWR